MAVATLCAALMAVLGFALSAGPASAAGTGYSGSPGTAGSSGTGAACVPGSILTASAIGTAGGTATALIGLDTITVSVPAGDLPDGSEVVITNDTSTESNPAPGYTVIEAYGVSICENGVKYTGTLSPIPVTITGGNITSNDLLYIEAGTTYSVVSGATVTAGSISYSLTSDPSYEVGVPSASETSTAIPNATVVVTGKPFLLEGVIAGALFLAGLLLMVRLRIRRTA